CVFLRWMLNIIQGDFHEWNPAGNNDFSISWGNLYVCIGIAGPATTVTSGPT
ncbi:hypothetical protein K469DRAFT_461118, partial [Zopfia rhizophila CBS 207.26]